MRTTIVLLLAAASPALAQRSQCHDGPGAAFGVTAYNCANCGIENKPDGKINFIFNTEPTILETVHGSGLKPGDKIEQINGYSIRTADGSNQFTYPAGKPAVITLIRDGKRMDVEAQHFFECAMGRFSLDAAYAASRLNPPPVRRWSVPGLLNRREVAEQGGRFGFGLACRPSCTFARASDGGYYYKFDGYPPIVALKPNGPAENAGLRIGDVVIKLNGHSILEEAGAVPWYRTGRLTSLDVTVLRDGEERTYTVRRD